MQPLESGRRRVVMEGIRPQVDGGRFAMKRIVGDGVVVEADVFTDGHEELAVKLQHRHEDESEWHELPMVPLGNDRWRGEFSVHRLGRHRYRIESWVDRFLSWRHDLEKRAAVGQDLHVDLLIGMELVRAATQRASGIDSQRLAQFAERIAAEGSFQSSSPSTRCAVAAHADLLALMDRYADRTLATMSHEIPIAVDDERAAFSAWYELFPRSYGKEIGQHGTLQDAIARLPYIAEMGFDVLYLPPIHPIGRAFRKGKNNAATADPSDVGSPWAIGGPEGGHKAIHPQLGTTDDFHALVAAAADRNIELALDIAFQCSPDHPYVREHPNWFRGRPDGTIQYAENPPKKYQDIFPFDFECDDWRALWEELTSIFLFWIEHGVRIFRVDNPHTKPFAFWETCIAEVKRVRPDAIFLSEAFTRPKIMYRLAKLGFTQSYTYFTWRNSKQELTEYFTELSQSALADVFRPNLWPNTPDVLHSYLQTGGRPAFIARAILAATLGANYGIYGAAFELLEHAPREPGSEEYLNSEKYELKRWEFERPDSLRELLARLNRIRREHAALQRNGSVTFHAIDSDQLLAFSKQAAIGDDKVLVVVNLDPHQTHSGWLELPAEYADGCEAIDLLATSAFRWHSPRVYIELNPQTAVAHVFHLRR
ncbi:MAG: alpha-1,4-glucan--maltose-1-phosphate maltosyltransferase [Pirellulales bacterium]|nr:alpha-1,4-glucan--maltose-1-phosphate maltosyltransferase [Pirellulales bacterium]